MLSLITGLFKKDRNKLISSFAHEIKHEFDDYKKPSISIKERIDYDMAKDMMKGITPLRKFAFLLYFIHKIENLVRPTEIASLLDSEQISKKEFISFIKNNSTYKHLEEAKQMSYDLLKAEMVEYIDKIKEIGKENNLEIDVEVLIKDIKTYRPSYYTRGIGVAYNQGLEEDKPVITTTP